MTSSAINDFNSMNYGAYQAGNQTKMTDPVEEMMTGFQDAMKLAGDQTFGNVSATYEASKASSVLEVTSSSSTSAYASSSGSNSVKDQLDTKSQTTEVKKTELSDEQTEDVVKDVKDVADKVVKTIADKLNISEEDVKEAMETLGLLVIDLLDSTNMTALVAQLTGTEPVQMVLDGDFFNTVQDLVSEVGEMINTDLSDLAQDLGIDFNDLLDAIKTAFDANQTQTQDVSAEVGGFEVADVAAASDKTTNAMEAVSTVSTTDVEDATVESTDSSVEITDSVEAVEVTVKDTTDDKAKTSSDAEEHSNFSNETGNQVSSLNNQTQVTATTTEAMNLTSVQDAQELIDQIADYVKTRQTGELTEMEIKLNPETLGNLHLQVAAKDGVITAHITTENEAVREALMTQAMILKDELNEQGLKVEAVEVTVASHEFEQNMQGEAGQQAQDLYEKEVNKQTRRRLVIENLAQAQEMLESDDLSDAEKLNIDMMTRSGNSMDIQA